ncbi:carotenoid biosynthesis protein [Alteribacter natronophilus]|uniref:carotenoid biosynthesis protein n=1 Tax=Alteribacter natronophilus TaxID=2583810 RepID=UPI00110F5DCC|nr:carotenoid biosynthesis protein [Alteribacter natronophilus]TMW73694.1 carotenoid biosynthesis protein [Alteribacter natronophilus]
MNSFDRYLFRFFIFWYICGVILLSFDLVPPWLEWANVVFLITAGILAMLYFYRVYGRITGLALITVVFVLSMALESLGVATGLFFGEYEYRTDFGPKIAGVPITIGFAWVMVIATSHVLIKPAAQLLGRLSSIMYPLLGAFTATSMDLIIDPVAYDVKEYWVWLEGGFYYGIPFSNFAGWFVLSFILHTFVYAMCRNKQEWRDNVSVWQSRMALLYFLMTAMFMAVALLNGLIAAFITTLTALTVIYTLYLSALRRLEGNRHTDKTAGI